MPEAVRRGAWIGARAVQVLGDTEGLPTRAELMRPDSEHDHRPTRKNVLVFRELPPDQLARLQARHDVTVANPRLPEQLPRFHAALRHAPRA